MPRPCTQKTVGAASARRPRARATHRRLDDQRHHVARVPIEPPLEIAKEVHERALPAEAEGARGPAPVAEVDRAVSAPLVQVDHEAADPHVELLEPLWVHAQVACPTTLRTVTVGLEE